MDNINNCIPCTTKLPFYKKKSWTKAQVDYVEIRLKCYLTLLLYSSDWGPVTSASTRQWFSRKNLPVRADYIGFILNILVGGEWSPKRRVDAVGAKGMQNGTLHVREKMTLNLIIHLLSANRLTESKYIHDLVYFKIFIHFPCIIQIMTRSK